MSIYWYAPKLRPPAFGGMPQEPKSLPLVQRKFWGVSFPAWAYDKRLPREIVDRYALSLVAIEDEIRRDDD